jgi:hypothetical protein
MNKVYDLQNFAPIEHWRTFDKETNLMFPWYTRPFLKHLLGFQMKDWKIFEYGGGGSTIWWRKYSREVHSVDTNISWSKKCDLIYVNDKIDFLSYPLKLIDDEKFDCIIIDGEPVQWRDECTEYALKAIKNGGIIIADNYQQKTVDLEHWTKTDELLKGYEKNVFKEPDHPDWKTACWKIENSR